MAGTDRTVEAVIAEIASRRHGVATRGLLLAAGVTRHEIDGRLALGGLIAVFPGVYRVGHTAPRPEADYLAAVLACGEESLLGGLAACWLLRLRAGTAPGPTVWSPREHRLPGVVCRRYRDPAFARRRRQVAGIPTVSVPRALVDVAAVLSVADLARACHEAGVKYRTTPRQVDAVLARNAPGAGRLRAIMSGDEQVTLSRLESAFRRLLREAGLPLPVMNKVASGRRIDCRWAAQRLTVELDSFTFHNSLHSWRRDRQREREAYARGDEFRRYAWSDVFEDPTLMLAELRGLLS